MRISQNNAEQPRMVVRQDLTSTHKTASFKGGADALIVGTMDAIERGGWAASFTVQDLLGTILPRPLTGLSRNKKENEGKKNTAFALKELIREVVTGPSMYVVPLGILVAGKKIVGQTVNTPAKLIDNLGGIFKDSVNNKNIDKPEEIIKTYYQKTFENMLSTATNTENKHYADEAEKLAQGFVELEGKQKKGFIKTLRGIEEKGSLQDAKSALYNSYLKIVKENSKNHTNDFTSAKLAGMDGGIEFNRMLNHMKEYGEDAIKHVTTGFKIADGKEFADELTSKLSNFNAKRITTRFGLNLGMAAAVVAFLSIVPDLYNKTSKGNPGLTGLDKDSTVATQENETTPSSKNPSFGSRMDVAKELVNKNGILSKIASSIEFNGFNMPFAVLLSTMTLGVFTPRIAKAKDNYDRTEIIRRDALSIGTLVFGEKIISNLLSRINERKSGFVLTSKSAEYADKSVAKKVFDYIRYSKGVNVLNSSQLISKYSNIHEFEDGLNGFCDFVNKEGGKLGKIFAVSDKTEKILEKYCPDFKKLDNDSIISALKNITKTDKDVIYNAFKGEKNVFVSKAKAMNSRFGFLSMFLFVPALLGFAIPKWNESCTKKAKAKENLEKQNAIVQQEQQNKSQVPRSVFDSIENKIA